VRELKNLLERALILGQGPELQPEDLILQRPLTSSAPVPEEISPATLATRLPSQLDLRKTMTEIEKALIVRSLELADGVQAEAARFLGLSRSDLGYKVSKYGLLNDQDERAQLGIAD
jgi:two-component system NtrC family response regulator